jgi:hypothetical protein
MLVIYTGHLVETKGIWRWCITGELYPTAGILNNQNVSQTGSIPVYWLGEEATYFVGLRRKS